MLRQDYNRRNAFFTTYYIYDTEKGHYIGLVEEHAYQVKVRYFIGWKFENNKFIPNTYRAGKSKMFDTYEEALNYIQEDFTK